MGGYLLKSYVNLPNGPPFFIIFKLYEIIY